MSRTSYRVASRDLSRIFCEGSLATASDAELLDRLNSDRADAAFEALVSRHERMVRRVCLDILGNLADAADASQATFVTLLRRGRSIRSKDALASWLHRVAVRSARRVRFETHRRRLAESAAGRNGNGLAVSNSDPSASLANEELRRALHDEIDRLPDRQRRPMILCGLEGLSQAEAAARLGWSEGSVRGRLARAKGRLRARLLRRGLAPGLVALIFEELALPARAVLEIAAASWVGSKVVGLVLAVAATLAAAALIDAPAGATSAPLPSPVVALPPPPPRKQTPPTPIPGRVAFQVRVVGPSGQPVPGARVYSIAGPFASPESAGVATDGSIPFDRPESSFATNFNSGNHQGGNTHAQVFAVADGFGIGWVGLAPASKDGKPAMQPTYDLTIKLVEDFPVTGRIVGPGGRPVAGALVSLDRVDAPENGRIDKALDEIRKKASPDFASGNGTDRWSGPRWLAAGRIVGPVSTDANGRFRLAGIGRDRRAGLIVSGPGIGTLSWNSITRDDLDDATRAVRERYPRQPSQTGKALSKMAVSYTDGLYGANAEIEVDPERTVAGTVRDARTGQPVANQEVRVEIPSSNEGSIGRTDVEGRYRIVRVDLEERVFLRVGGSVGVHGGCTPYLGLARELVVGLNSGETTVDFALEPGVVVSGRVLEAGTGRPMPARDFDDCPSGQLRAGFISYMPLAGNKPASEGELGRYYRSLPPSIRPGDVLVTILADGTFRAVVPPGPGVLMVEPYLGTGLFSMFGPWNESRGVHLRHAYAYLSRRVPDDGAGAVPGVDDSALPGAVGPIPLEKFVTYQVIHPTAGRELSNLTIAIPKPLTRQIRLISPTGEPVRGASVSGVIQPQVGTSPLVNQGRPVILEGDRIEILALDPIQPRECTALSGDGRLFARFTVRGDSAEPLTITMEPSSSLSGRLLGASGQPIAGATIAVEYEIEGSFDQSRYCSIPMPPRSTTEADGRFVVQGLWPGMTARLTFTGPAIKPTTTAFPFQQPPSYRAASLNAIKLAPGENRDAGDVRGIALGL